MKYIKKLNIDFDQWGELNKCIYLIFRNGNHLFISYIIKKNNNFFVVLLNGDFSHNIRSIHNVNKQIKNDDIINFPSNILYGDLIKTDFYKNNKILIVGIDVDYINILKNPESYINNNDCKTKIKLK